MADASQLEPAALGEVDKDDDEVHDHLMHECSWYATICDGENPDDDCPCGPSHDDGGTLVKFTPRTPEASTVDKPTVPPGGPGLFHVKGLHLPPYFQHLYSHLVARYGKQGAYRVAVGVVKKWAAGVNPGGWKTKSGKGKRTHPDVRAAAAKNVAQWEADKAKAHAQSAKHASGHVKAAAPQPGRMEGGAKAGSILPLPPPPKKTAAMMVAHRVKDMQESLAHAIERMDAARKSKDPVLRVYESIHIRNHLTRTIGSGHMLADNLRRNYPAEGRELDATVKTLGLAKALTPALKAATTAHLLETVLNECVHASRHAQFLGKADPRNQWEFNAEHTDRHLKSALVHACKLHDHIMDNYPAEAKLLAELHDLAAGKEVRAAAPAAWATISAPGAGRPQQAASSPLPKVDLPVPKEIRQFASKISKMTDDQDHHLVAAQMHLESAAEKMATNPISALASLRSAQTAIQQAWRYRAQQAGPHVAYVFSVNASPAEQASQQQVQAKERARIGEMREAVSKIAVFIGRVRRSYFGQMGMVTEGGGLAGYPNASQLK